MANSESNRKDDLEEIQDPRNNLAVERTELALERTHLSWIRTLFTLITAGIAIDKVAELMHQRRIQQGVAFTKNAHIVGIMLTSVGTFMLLLETVAYVVRSKQLAKMKKGRFHYFNTLVFLSLIVFLLGCLLTWVLIMD